MANVTHYAIDYIGTSDKPWAASINCYDQPEGEAGGSRIAVVRFYRGSVPASGQVGGVPVVNFPLARFADVISIFRQEQRIFVGHEFGGPDAITMDGITTFTPVG